jgi:hypothetical protein
MFGAGVPKATIDEHYDARTREHEVRSTPAGEHRAIDEVASPTPVELAAYTEFWLGVSTTDACHSSTHDRVYVARW